MAETDAMWGARIQQDAHEFLTALFRALRRDCNRVAVQAPPCAPPDTGTVDEQAAAAVAAARALDDSWLDDVLGGLLVSSTASHACGHGHHRFEAFTGAMSVPILRPAADGRGTVTLQACLDSHFAAEDLEKYRCDRPECATVAKAAAAQKAKSTATHKAKPMGVKSTVLHTPPRCLVLQLKRFQHNWDAASRCDAKKVATAVDVPATITVALAGSGARAARYTLVGVTHHAGSLEHGHYWSTARAASDGTWRELDDSRVTRLERAPLGPSATAYVLFWRLS